jgi:hypothetical protein
MTRRKREITGLANGSTLLSIRVAMKARLRERRSSLAMTSLALCLRQAARAFWRFGAIRAFGGLDLGILGDELPGAAIEIGNDGLALGVEATSARWLSSKATSG